jgi:hypothetical protein
MLSNNQTPPLRRNIALRDAWLAYIFLLMLPFVVLAVVLISHANTATPPRVSHGMSSWFLGTMAYLAVGVPAALFYRRHLSGAYFRGQVVSPRHYLAGMLTVWLTLEIGMIAPLIGCFVTGSFLPDLLPAILAFMFFVVLCPTGKMMTSHVGSSEDPQIYKEPR